jgi:hypothetical protein
VELHQEDRWSMGLSITHHSLVATATFCKLLIMEDVCGIKVLAVIHEILSNVVDEGF